jgi:hypothetical protein
MYRNIIYNDKNWIIVTVTICCHNIFQYKNAIKILFEVCQKAKDFSMVLFHPSCNYCTSAARYSIGRSHKFIHKVAVEESIMNAPLVSLQSKNTNNAKK